MNYRDQAIPFLGAVAVAAVGLTYNYIYKTIDITTTVAIILVGVGLYATLLLIYSSIVVRPREQFERFEDLHTRINMTVETLIRKQQFIEQKTLGLIEENAEDIWVITTSLANELSDADLAKTVSDNLAKGKKYKYFLPHPNHPYFKRVDRNIENYKALPFYNEYKGNIEFIRMPIHALLLLEEVVIYNPYQPEKIDEDFSGINGFTYYRSNDDEHDKSLHMRIEGEFLKFLAEQLDNYLRDTGLKNTVEDILIEYDEVLSDAQKAHLASLLGKSSIYNNSSHQAFTKSLQTVSEVTKSSIIDRLSRHEIDFEA